MPVKTYKVIGIMSGTSLDGVDIAFCEFTESASWNFKIHRGHTIPYGNDWKNTLANLHQDSAAEFASCHTKYGHYLGSLVRDFLRDEKSGPDFVASHGHTIFHQPGKGFTSQIGDGAALAASCGFPVVCDFRSADVALGGQGAPLVPVGDSRLFPDQINCLNLGGIANISFDEAGLRRAYDVCPCNILLNRLAERNGLPMDEDGKLAERGKVNEKLLAGLNSLVYYSSPFPKSLGRESIDQSIWPIFESSELCTEDLLATGCEHIALQIVNACRPGSLFITGGGALNRFLVSRIRHHHKSPVIIPDTLLIHFKEALVFAFLGMLRWRNEINCLRSVTGASRDSCSGAIYQP